MSGEDPKWVQVQQKTFTRWCNTFLLERDLKIGELDKDLQDGVNLFSLLEILSGETIKPKVNKKARMKLQKIENLNFSFKFLQEKRIKLVNISSEDIYEQKKKLILGLIWTLILRFQIQQVEAEDDGKNSVKKDLLDWCNRVLNPQGVYVKNFTTDWQDAAGFSGLVNYCKGGEDIDLSSLNKDDKGERIKNLNTAFEKSEEYFDFPPLLDAEDVVDVPDELSMMTYISYYRGWKTENTACAAKSIAYGPGLTDAKTHHEAGYTVELKNDEGERVRVGGTNVTGTMVLGDERIKVKVKDNKDGTYACTYVVTKPGVYELNVLCEGNHIKDSPFSPDVQPSEADASTTTANPPTPVVAGEAVEFVVQTRDVNGNEKPDGGEEISAKMEGVEINVEDKNDGTYNATYTAEKAGDFDLHVLLKSDDIKDSPYKITVKPAGPDAKNTTAEGDGISAADTDNAATFKVITRDRFGNECDEGGHKITGELAGTGDIEGQKVPVEIKDNGDGTYTASYQAKKAGEYTMPVSLSGASIKDAPFTVKVESGAATAGNTSAEGDGLTKVVAGETGTFVVQTRDANNNNLVKGGDKIEGKLSGPGDVTVEIKDQDNGTYDGSYVPTVTGDYELTLTHDGSAIQDSPFKVQVVPAGPSAANTEASGDGISTANTDEPATFKIQTKDAFGNNCVEGGADITVEATGPEDEKVTGNVKDNGDGTYDVDYQPKGAGEFTLDVKLGGENIKDAPFTVKVAPGTATAGNTIAEGEGLREVVAGETGEFKVTTKDANGNVLESGGCDINAALSGTDDVKVEVKDNDNGTYDASYVAEKVGEYTLNVKLADDGIKDSPFTVNVLPAGPSAANTEASGDGISKANTDEPATFKIQTKDAFGNNCDKGGAPIVVKVTGPNDEAIDGNVKDNGDGTYDVDYQPKGAGEFTVDVKLGDENIKDAPFTVTVDPGKATSGNTTAEGDGLTKVVAGETGEFKVTTKDANDNVLLVGDNTVAAKLSGPEDVSVDIKDNSDGTYDASYVPKIVGDYTLAVQLDSDDIKDSPFKVQVVPAAPSAANTEASGDGIATANTDEPATFKIQTKDAFGNNCVEGGADITVEAAGPNDEKVAGNVKDNGDGTYDVDYQPKGSGEFTLDVKLGGENIKDAPFTVKVAPGKAVAGNSVAEGDGLTKVVAGETGSFTVQTKDGNGNLCDFGGNTVTGALSGADDVSCEVKDNGSGTYDCTYVPTKAGNYKLDVNVDGDAINDSPFKVLVVPAASVPEQTLSEGSALSSAVAGVKAILKVQARDQFENEAIEGGDKITGTITGPAGEQECDVKDFGNGKYRVQYVGPEKAGEYKVSIKLAGQDVKDSPFTVDVATAPGSGKNSTANGDGLKQVVAGETGEFVVTTNDKFGNQLPKGGLKVRATGKGPRALKPDIADNDDGTYKGTFVPTRTGDYKMKVTVQGEALPDSPYDVKVIPAKANGSKSLATGSGLSEATVDTPGKEGAFVVETRDEFGNKCVEGGANLKATLKGGSKDETIEAEVKDCGDGKYECAYDIVHGGIYELNITIDGEAVHHSPYSVNARPGKTDPKQTEILDNAGKATAGTKGFRLQLKDKHGNPRDQGGDDVEIRFERPVTRKHVGHDVGDGTFDVHVPPDLQGAYKVIAMVDGEDVEVGEIDVADNKMADDEEQEIRKKFPGASDAMVRLLNQATPEERKMLFSELRTGMLPDAELAAIREKEEAERAAAREAEAKAQADALQKLEEEKEAKAKALADELAALEEAEQKALEEAQAEIEALEKEMETADEEERARLAKELADEMAQHEKEAAEFEKKLAAAADAAEQAEAEADVAEEYSQAADQEAEKAGQEAAKEAAEAKAAAEKAAAEAEKAAAAEAEAAAKAEAEAQEAKKEEEAKAEAEKAEAEKAEAEKADAEKAEAAEDDNSKTTKKSKSRRKSTTTTKSDKKSKKEAAAASVKSPRGSKVKKKSKKK